MATDLRCESKKFGELLDHRTLEVKCSSRFCGAVPGEIVVLHTFDLLEGTMKTRKFKEPNQSPRRK